MQSYGKAVRKLWEERKHLGGAGAKRLEFLLRWSRVRVEHKKDYEKRRRLRSRSKSWKRFTKASCWVCHVVKATCRHHIIQVQHGGGNDDRNLVSLCEGCHAEVHPWMDASEHSLVREAKAMDEFQF